MFSVGTFETRRVSKVPTENMGSYELFLQAWRISLASTNADVRGAADLLDRAIALDPEFSTALGLAAIIAAWLTEMVATDEVEPIRRRAVELAHRTVRAGGDDAMAITLAAGALIWAGEPQEVARALIDRAMALNPGSFLAWYWRGLLRLKIGDADGAAGDIETSIRFDPFSPLRGHQLFNLARARFVQRRFGEAMALSAQSTQLIPAYTIGHILMAATQGHLGQPMQAREALARARELSDRPPMELVAIWYDRPEDRSLVAEGLALAEAG